MSENKRQALVGSVREGDVEPYTALRWVGTLFKAAAVFLAVALIGEVVAGIRESGTAVIPDLLGELARTIVLAVVMWGAGDLVRLMIQLGHDVRAERILLARLVHRTPPRDAAEGAEAGSEEGVVPGDVRAGDAEGVVPGEVRAEGVERSLRSA